MNVYVLGYKPDVFTEPCKNLYIGLQRITRLRYHFILEHKSCHMAFIMIIMQKLSQLHFLLATGAVLHSLMANN